MRKQAPLNDKLFLMNKQPQTFTPCDIEKSKEILLVKLKTPRSVHEKLHSLKSKKDLNSAQSPLAFREKESQNKNSKVIHTRVTSDRSNLTRKITIKSSSPQVSKVKFNVDPNFGLSKNSAFNKINFFFKTNTRVKEIQLLTKRNPNKEKPCTLCKEGKVDLIIKQQLYNKYEAPTQDIYNINLMNDLITNANTQLVSIFKDHLIFDDLTELLNQFHELLISKDKLKQLIFFYDLSSKVFPNFAILGEKKYMFKNIKRKQKLIDLMLQEKEQQKTKCAHNTIFDKKFIESKLSQHNDIEDIIDDFIMKDSMSLINKSDCKNIDATFCEQKCVRRLSQLNVQELNTLEKKKVSPYFQLELVKNNCFTPKAVQSKEVLEARKGRKLELPSSREKLSLAYFSKSPSCHKFERQYSDFSKAFDINSCSTNAKNLRIEFKFSKKFLPRAITKKNLLPTMIVLGKNVKFEKTSKVPRNNKNFVTQKEIKHLMPIAILKLPHKKLVQSNSKQNIGKIRRVYSPYEIKIPTAKLLRQQTEAKLQGGILIDLKK